MSTGSKRYAPAEANCQTYPTEVDLPFDGELETKVAVLYTR